MANEQGQEKESSGQDRPQQGDPQSIAEKPPIPAELQRLDAKTFAIAQEFFSFHSGPLPPAKQLAEYESACRGAARDIIEMAKVEQSTRHYCARTQVDAITRGQRLGGLCFAIAMAAVCYLASIGATVAAGTIGATAITAFGAAFILARHLGGKKDDEDDED